MGIEASHLLVGWLSTEPVKCDDECGHIGVLVVLMRCESEQLLLTLLVHQLNIGRRHTCVVVQRALVYRPSCPWLLVDLWRAQRIIRIRSNT